MDLISALAPLMVYHRFGFVAIWQTIFGRAHRIAGDTDHLILIPEWVLACVHRRTER
jgi:hypothetical protein